MRRTEGSTGRARTKCWTEVPVGPFRTLETVLEGARSTWSFRGRLIVTNNIKLHRKIPLIACAVLLVGISCFFAFLLFQSSSQPFAVNPKAQIVGIWKNKNTILEYRRDGTARSWEIHGKTIRSTYSHLTYRLHDGELYIYYSAKSKGYIQMVNEAVFGMTTDHYQVVKLSNDELQLLDCGSGVTVAFERSDDTILKSSP